MIIRDESITEWQLGVNPVYEDEIEAAESSGFLENEIRRKNMPSSVVWVKDDFVISRRDPNLGQTFEKSKRKYYAYKLTVAEVKIGINEDGSDAMETHTCYTSVKKIDGPKIWNVELGDYEFERKRKSYNSLAEAIKDCK